MLNSIRRPCFADRNRARAMVRRAIGIAAKEGRSGFFGALLEGIGNTEETRRSAVQAASGKGALFFIDPTRARASS